jgi:glutamine amidotransferase
MRRVGIIDYGLCNIDSIARAIEVCGGSATVTRAPDAIAGFDLLVLPGVGAFGAAMANLTDWGLADAIKERVSAGTPLLGICLGMQLLACSSEEGGVHEGLGLVPGEVVRLETGSQAERIPHMGWNEVDQVRTDPLLKGIDSGTDFYFVHSYHLRCREEADVLARTRYCGGFVSMVRHDNVAGAQFHPEKSWPAGHKLLANFISSA